jgi:hypothetical protein
MKPAIRAVRQRDKPVLILDFRFWNSDFFQGFDPILSEYSQDSLKVKESLMTDGSLPV